MGHQKDCGRDVVGSSGKTETKTRTNRGEEGGMVYAKLFWLKVITQLFGIKFLHFL